MKKIIETKSIEEKIYNIRGVNVMLDSDLAIIYNCANGTKTINQAVRRHVERFPSDFYFQLDFEEYDNLKSQFGTSNLKSNYGGVRKLPYAFTEQCVAMLATVLRTSVATNMSIKIMRAFVSMRKYISSNLLEQKYINNLVLEDHDKIKILETSFNKSEEKIKNNETFFNGQIYDAYSKILDIFNEAKNDIIIVDCYADKKLLDIIKRLNIDVIIITKKNKLLTSQDVTNYNKQYNNLRVVYDDTFHDRYFIIDGKVVYHCGTSINRIGYKTFSISLMSDKISFKSLLERINQMI